MYKSAPMFNREILPQPLDCLVNWSYNLIIMPDVKMNYYIELLFSTLFFRGILRRYPCVRPLKIEYVVSDEYILRVPQFNKKFSFTIIERNYSSASNKGKKSVKFLSVDGTVPSVVLTSVWMIWSEDKLISWEHLIQIAHDTDIYGVLFYVNTTFTRIGIYK